MSIEITPVEINNFLFLFQKNVPKDITEMAAVKNVVTALTRMVVIT